MINIYQYVVSVTFYCMHPRLCVRDYYMFHLMYDISIVDSMKGLVYMVHLKIEDWKKETNIFIEFFDDRNKNYLLRTWIIWRGRTKIP